MEAAVIVQVYGLLPGGPRQHDVNDVLLLLVVLLVLAVVMGWSHSVMDIGKVNLR